MDLDRHRELAQQDEQRGHSALEMVVSCSDERAMRASPHRELRNCAARSGEVDRDW